MSHIVYEIAADVNPATGARGWTYLATTPDADIARALCLAVKAQFKCEVRHKRLEVQTMEELGLVKAAPQRVELDGLAILDALRVIDGRLMHVDIGGKARTPSEYAKALAAGEIHAS